ncbi:hypothetical protein MHU86_822 [Fragilaria crotonensis]|nr:hypothetical protein MHU86_822 [Fragilaria crotonensis]
MTPTINHLDQARIEYNADGTTIERSTREWAATILAVDNVSPALCDVVNGPPDHKAYLLVPSQYLQKVQQEWRSYKSRLYPPNQREARYRDKIPGLPDVIHIQAEIAANVSFLDKLSTAAGWHDNIQEQVSTFPNARAEGEVNRAQNHISKRRSEGSPEWPTPMEASNPMRPLRNAWKTKQGQVAADLNSAGGDTSIGTDEDRSAGSTHSLTHASRTSSDTKFLELERSMKRSWKHLMYQAESLQCGYNQSNNSSQGSTNSIKNWPRCRTKWRRQPNRSKSGELQKHISADMEEMKVLTEKQFTEMNNRLLTNMECQHKMSTTMLDLHAHFEKLSAFMEGLATKWNLIENQDQSLRWPPWTNHLPSRCCLKDTLRTYTSSASSASGSSQSNAQSVTSSASSKVYCSRKRRNNVRIGNSVTRSNSMTILIKSTVPTILLVVTPKLSLWKYVLTLMKPSTLRTSSAALLRSISPRTTLVCRLSNPTDALSITRSP